LKREDNLTPDTRVPYGPRRPPKVLVAIGIAMAAALLVALAVFVSRVWLSPDYQGVVEQNGSSIVIRKDEGGFECAGQMRFAPATDVDVKRDGEKIEWTDIELGDHVKVWTNGNVDDSCPGEAGAEKVEVD
jgi:hypothetical protein